MKALPTKYKGVQYRSLLEARWAAFFDIMGVLVDYEPEAFNGYIPDFLTCPVMPHWTFAPYDSLDDEHPSVLFEVKGILEQFDLAKIRNSGWRGVVVCLTSSGPAAVQLLDGGVMQSSDMSCGEAEDFKDLLQFLSLKWGREFPDMQRAWIEAGNRVQWKGRSA